MKLAYSQLFFRDTIGTANDFLKRKTEDIIKKFKQVSDYVAKYKTPEWPLNLQNVNGLNYTIYKYDEHRINYGSPSLYHQACHLSSQSLSHQSSFSSINFIHL